MKSMLPPPEGGTLNEVCIAVQGVEPSAGLRMGQRVRRPDPIADLAARLQNYVSLWLDNPDDWTEEPKDQSERDAA